MSFEPCKGWVWASPTFIAFNTLEFLSEHSTYEHALTHIFMQCHVWKACQQWEDIWRENNGKCAWICWCRSKDPNTWLFELEEEYKEFDGKLSEVKNSVSKDCETLILELLDTIERNLILLGATVVEDKLQNGVV